MCVCPGACACVTRATSVEALWHQPYQDLSYAEAFLVLPSSFFGVYTPQQSEEVFRPCLPI